MFVCVCVLLLLLLLLLLGIDGPVNNYTAPPEPVVGGLLVNVGSEEEEEPLPRAKVSYNTAFSIF